MKKRFEDISLKYKAAVMMVVVSLIPLIVLGTCIVVMYSNVIKERSRMHIDENIRIMSSRISSVFVDANLCSNHVLLNLNQIEDENVKQEIIKDNKIQNLLNQSVLIFDGIESIVYVTAREKVYSTNVELLYSNRDQILSSSYKEQLLNANGKTRLFDKAENCMNTNNSVVTMGKRIIHIVTGETMGYLFVNIAGEYLVQADQNSISQYLVFDNAGNSIIEYESGHILEDEELCEELYDGIEIDEYHYEGEKYLVARNTVPEYGWSVIGITNLNKFNINKQELMGITVFVGIIITILTGVVSLAATASITKPLLKLKKGAEEIANGNLEVYFNFRTEDEIGKLGDIFNTMTRKIKELLIRVDEEAKKKRVYELSLLQEQIKPHFLYNTLDIIVVLIEMKREWEAARVVKKLANYYKNSLSSSEEIISLETEVQIIEDYLELQNIRYGDMFTYKICVDEEIMSASIPKLTLQPLIENAIYHGLKYRGNKGNIQVEANLVDDKVLIKVMDNGIGIQEDKLKEIRKFTEKAEKHFGLYSVKHRLRLYYGTKARLQIDSKYEEGTCITIEIPRENSFDKDNDSR